MNKLIIMMLLLSVFFINGCSYRDIDKRFFVVAMGIDKSSDKKNPYKVILKLDIPSSQIQPGRVKAQIITQNANSIPEAIRIMQAKVDKRFEFGHCRVILFNKNILKNNQLELLNWFMRRRDIQGIVFLGVADPNVKKVLENKVKSERLPANALVLAFDETVNNSPYMVTEILNDYYMRLKERGIDAYLPIVKPIPGSYKIDTVAVMHGEKLQGNLDKDETRMFNEMMNTVRKGQINIATGKENFFINVDSLHTKLKLLIPKGNKPYMDVSIKINGFIEQSVQEVETNRDIKKYEAISEKVLNTRFLKFIKRLQALKSDPYGLGLDYQAKMGVSKTVMDQWEALYPNLEFHVHTMVKIQGSGTMK